MADVLWEAPGAGLWTLDRVHVDHPLSGFSRGLGNGAPFDGLERGWARSGVALGRPASALVNGWSYGQRGPVDRSLWPERERAAQLMIEGRGWRAVGDAWHAQHRPAIYGACRDLQQRDPAALDDAGVGDLIEAAIEVLGRAQGHHFEQMGLAWVVGELLAECSAWGIPDHQSAALLAGASPGSTDAAVYVARIADALRAAGDRPTSLDAVREASEDAAAALDDYLFEHGTRVVGGFDVDDLTLVELPDAILTSIQAAVDLPVERSEPDIDSVRLRVPEDARPRFDELLEEARFVYALRDDDVGPVMWGRGLIRRAVLEAGRRLAGRGALRQQLHALECSPGELLDLLRTNRGPSARELSDRAALRLRQARLDPPTNLGTPSSPPPSDLPPGMTRVTRGLNAYMAQARASDGERLRGQGIGRERYQGRARLVRRAEEAIATLDPGDVLITRMTTPAFNSIMQIAGAVVTEQGGLMTHAAITARELGLPAVVGVTRAMADIHDGDIIEVDPLAGTISVIDRPVSGPDSSPVPRTGRGGTHQPLPGHLPRR